MPEELLDGLHGERRAAERVRGVDLVLAEARHVDDHVARDRELGAVPAADPHQLDRVRAPAPAGLRAGLPRALRPHVGAEDQDRRRARRSARPPLVSSDRVARVDPVLEELRAEQEQHDRERDPADAARSAPSARRARRRGAARGAGAAPGRARRAGRGAAGTGRAVTATAAPGLRPSAASMHRRAARRATRRRAAGTAAGRGRSCSWAARRGPPAATAGRPPSGDMVAAVADRCVIGVDVGGTKVLAGVVDEQLAVRHRAQRSSQDLDTAALLDALAQMVLEAIDAVGDEIAGVGFGVPGVIDRRNGMVAASPHLPLGGVPLPGADGRAARPAGRRRQRRELLDARRVAPRRGAAAATTPCC